MFENEALTQLFVEFPCGRRLLVHLGPLVKLALSVLIVGVVHRGI